MFFDPNSLTTSVIVTALTAVMVLLLPWLDYLICGRLGLSLNDGVSSNPEADRLLMYRKALLVLMFLLYLAAVCYVTLLSRSAGEDFSVHVDFLTDFAGSFQMDLGFLGFLNYLFRYGPREAFQQVHIINAANIAQVYMNICLFIPMGYLLPYIFDWYRRSPIRRTIATSFLTSLLIENIQLVTKLGLYDVDDLFCNTLGGWVGVHFYILIAYRLTHPDWRRRRRKYRVWRIRSRSRALSPFFRKLNINRVSLNGTDPMAVREFYEKKLGMYPSEIFRDPEGREKGILFEFGRNQLAIRIVPSPEGGLPEQGITIACNNSERLKKSLEYHGIETGSYEPDPYTGLRTFSFRGPDNAVITIIEE